MKSVNGLLISILISIASLVQAQDNNLTVQEICLPESVIDQIIINRINQDHLQYVVDVQDSILKIYYHKDSTSKVEIQGLKLSALEYKQIIKNYIEMQSIDKATIKDLKKEIRRTKIKGIFVQSSEAVIIAILLYFTFKP